jgi:alkylated DNA repair dioxygenase AlkB
MTSTQPRLFNPDLFPAGFQYREGICSPDEEQTLIAAIEDLPFREFEFRGFLGKRRTVSFGWRYDFTLHKVQEAEQIPRFLVPLQEQVAEFAGVKARALEHILVTEYPPGVGIGWHRDRPEFGDVIGVSLGAPCLFRFRRKSGLRWERASSELQPRSAYLLRGPARSEWQHSIPPVDQLRYSITFRTIRRQAK